MSFRLGPVQRRVAWFATPLLLGLVIGVGVVIASSPASLNPGRHQTNGLVQPTPTPLDASPAPSVTTPGQLGEAPRLMSNGSSTLIGLGANVATISTDRGKTWSAIRPPSNGSGIAVDPANPQHVVTGGATIQFSVDGGATWKNPLAAPPGKGPYEPIAVSPFDGNVWFFLHQNRLLRTRDGSLTWVEIAGLPNLSNPVLAPAPVVGEFFLAAGGRLFQLIDNGQRVNEEPPLPAGASVTDLVVLDGSRPLLLARGAADRAFVLSGSTWATGGGGLAGPVAAAAGGTMLVGNGGAKLGQQGLVSYSTDGGLTWIQSIGLPFDQTVEALAGQLNSSSVFAYCYGGDVYVSTDGGRVWGLLTRDLRNKNG